MPRLHDLAARQEILARIARLNPGVQPLWGRMNVCQMLVHTGHQLKNGLGELKIKPMPGPYRLPPLYWLVIYVIPWPKGVATAPELVDPPTRTWQEEKAALLECIERFANKRLEEPWGEHPMFGAIPGKHWSALAWRHLDWHLRQFGV
jgi:hypothetical protein